MWIVAVLSSITEHNVANIMELGLHVLYAILLTIRSTTLCLQSVVVQLLLHILMFVPKL